MALYIYFAKAKVNAITLLNHLGLFVSYKVLLEKFRDITSASKLYIKKQANNAQLIGTWDNFEFRKNVEGERVGDVIKFRSIIIVLWIKNGWQILVNKLKQKMWNLKRDVLKTQTLVRLAIRLKTWKQ